MNQARLQRLARDCLIIFSPLSLPCCHVAHPSNRPARGRRRSRSLSAMGRIGSGERVQRPPVVETSNLSKARSGAFTSCAPLRPQIFAQVEIGRAQPLAVQLAVQPDGVGRGHAAEVVRPLGGVRDGHGSARPGSRGAHFGQVALPPDLCAQAAHAGLARHLNEQVQADLDRRLLDAQAAGPHGLVDQLVVGEDVGAHVASGMALRACAL